MKRPTLRRREDTLAALEAALGRSEADRDEAEGLIAPLAQAVREVDLLDADIALGNIESAVARTIQNEKRDELRRAVTRRDNAAKAIEALRRRGIAAVAAERQEID